jgi:hypothetical protein
MQPFGVQEINRFCMAIDTETKADAVSLYIALGAMCEKTQSKNVQHGFRAYYLMKLIPKMRIFLFRNPYDHAIRDYYMKLYVAEYPPSATNIIKQDLEYVANKWRDLIKSNDLLIDHIAGILLMGAQLARDRGDPKAADHYWDQHVSLTLS